MPSQIITLQVGQCGNQVGSTFWKRICREHGISKTGKLNAEPQPEVDRKDVYFYEPDDGRYVPRAIMMSLEPRVVQGILKSDYGELYNKSNTFISEVGCGGGNNWACGYSQSVTFEEKIFQLINREAERADGLEGFLLCHSTSGGTGSGMGSFLLENLCDNFPKKLINTVSIFPNQDGSSNIVTEPYNSVLTIRRLIQHADSVIVFDNTALNRIAFQQFRMEVPTLLDMNETISKVMSMSTATLRFPSYMNNTMVGLIASLFPAVKLHFLMASYSPLFDSNKSMCARKPNMLDVILDLLNPLNSLVTTKIEKGSHHRYISAVDIIQNSTDVSQLSTAMSVIRKENKMNFMSWSPTGLQVVLSRSSPYISCDHLTGIMLANHTCLSNVFLNELTKFNKLKTRGAFLKEFKRYDMFSGNLFEFDESTREITNIIDEYEAATKDDFLNFAPKNNEIKRTA